jgi:Leucine-rich repeat (LRR) protein
VVEAKNNKLEEFPPFQHHPYFPSLTHLDLSCNKFSEIPRQITYIENLRTLHFCFNKINTIEVLLHDHDLLQKL